MKEIISNNIELLCLISIIFSLIAIIIGTIVLISFLNYRSESNEVERIVKIVKNSSRIDSHIKGLMPIRSNKVELTANQIEKIAAVVLETLRPSKDVCTEPIVTIAPEKTTIKLQKLFASACNTDKQAFYTISEHPSDETIYVLEVDINNGRGKFDLHSAAIDKVIECRDFLEGACSTSGNGNRIEVEGKGTVVYSNGEWVVEDKLKIKFS